MPITEQERKGRKNHIGSSDIAAIMGLDCFKSAHDVWLTKMYDTEASPESMAIKRGNLFEPALVKYAANKLGDETYFKNLHAISKAHPVFAAQLDGMRADHRQGIEAKTTGNYKAWENGVPDHVQLQCQHQMLCFGINIVHVVADLPEYYMENGEPKITNTIQIYPIERDDKIINAIIKFGEAWWKRHIIKKIEPKITKLPKEEVYKYITRDCNKVVGMKYSLVRRWDMLNKKAKRIQKVADKAKAIIIAKLGDAEAGQIATSGEFVTYYANKRGTRTLKYPDKPWRKKEND